MSKYSVTVWDSVTNETFQLTIDMGAAEVEANNVVNALHDEYCRATGEEASEWRIKEAYYMPCSGAAIYANARGGISTLSYVRLA